MIMFQASVCMSLNLSPSVHLQSVPVLASVLLLMAMLPSARPNLWEVWQVIIATLASIWLAVVSDTAKKVEIGIKRNHFAKVSIFFHNSALKNLVCLPNSAHIHAHTYSWHQHSCLPWCLCFSYSQLVHSCRLWKVECGRWAGVLHQGSYRQEGHRVWSCCQLHVQFWLCSKRQLN